MRQFFALLFLLLCSMTMAPPASAQQVSEADQSAFRSVIEDQISAFRAGDGARAYGHASPKIKSIFPGVEMFMGMVEKGYPQIWDPKSFTFGAVTDELGQPTQRVIITDQAGRVWTALYAFEKQPDGSWKINGVQLLDVGSEA